MSLMDKLREAMRTWLYIEPGRDQGAITITQPLSFDAHVLRNRMWYRGDPSELEDFFKQCASDSASRSRFWAAVPDVPLRKIHVDIATQMVDRLAGIIAGDMEGFEIPDRETERLWDEIARDNRWPALVNDSVVETLCTGDGAYKISIDRDVSPYPIIEFYGTDRVTPVMKRGRIQEIVFHTLFHVKTKRYRLDEHYGPGYIRSRLYLLETNADREVPLEELPETQGIQREVLFQGQMLAVYLKFFDSPLWTGRGASILASKTEALDALDEVVSEWWDDYRKGRVKQFMPESMFPRDPDNGKILRPRGFDDMFVLTQDILNENGDLNLLTFAPDIRAEKYLAGYAQALDMALLGVVSPSTLGIDLKKTDNAEAQREKEKATLWTRTKIVDALNVAWPQLVQAAITAADNMAGKVPRRVEATVTFGEYASPSFDTQLQTMGVAAQWNLMSIEQMVEELYGDTKDDKWKATEVERIKELRGIATLDMPAPGGPLRAEKPKIGEDVNADTGKP